MTWPSCCARWRRWSAPRTVDAAVAELRPEQIQAALPRLQPDGLSSATRKAMKAHKGLDKQLQDTAAAAVGVEDVQLQHLERVQPRRVMTLVATTFAAYILIHEITGTKDLPATLANADWGWALLAVVCSALTYIGAALNLLGGFGRRLSLWLTTAAVGGSFINLITPVKVGGTATNIRYLQKQGLDSAAAIGGMGVTILVVGVMHIALTIVFLVWAGSKTNIVKLPSSSTILLILVVVAAIIGLAVAIRPARSWSVPWSSRRWRRRCWSCARPCATRLGCRCRSLARSWSWPTSARCSRRSAPSATRSRSPQSGRSTSPAAPWPPPPPHPAGSAPWRPP